MKYLWLFIFIVLFQPNYGQEKQEKCTNSISGTVINYHTKNPMVHALVELKLKNVLIEKFYTLADGKFSFDLDCDQRYQLSALLENHTKSIKLVYTNMQISNHHTDLELIPIEEFIIKDDEKYILTELIEFEPDSFEINKSISTELDHVIKIMEKYPSLKIEIGFHSNNLGNLDFLKSLTQKRADICANYLIERGIEATRINAIGYGFSKPIAPCDTENMKNKKERCTENFRTEFKIIDTLVE